MSEDFLPTVPVAEIPVGTMRALVLAGYNILVINLAGEFFAVENRCSHADSTLDGGRLRMGRISCPLHGAMFDIRTGASKSGNLVRTGIRTFATRVVDGTVHVASAPAPALTSPMA